MSTYLELVQKLHRDCGCAGSEPTSVVSQTGEAKRLVNYVADADGYIQKLWTTWRFLWTTDTGRSTAANVAVLSKPTDLLYWDRDTFRIDGDIVDVVDYFDIRTETLDTTSRALPSRVIIMPDESLKFDPIPDAIYTFAADYYKVPTRLAANVDVSAIPLAFHDVISGRAQMLYGNYENAPEMKTQGAEIYGEFLGRLENSQLPTQQNARFKGAGGFFEVQTE